MGKVVRAVAGLGLTIAGIVTGNFQLAFVGISLIGGALFGPKAPRRAAVAAQMQLGEQPRQAVLGRAATAGSLVDAFNYGGKYGTDWEVLVIAIADHRCDALEGFFVDDSYVAFAGDGNVAGYNSQLQVFWRDGQWGQSVPAILTTNGPGWTANDRGRGVAYVVVAYKADASDAKNPIWPGGRPRFRWVVRGLRCYQPRKDSTVGGSGAHRWNNPATWEWTENPIDIRHNWVRGIYAGDRNNQPEMLLVGRGLSDIEAPPANVFARANLCDEVVGGQARYRIGGLVASTEAFIEVETDFAAAVGGIISQPQGAVEVDPGQARAVVATFTDADLLVGSAVNWNEGILGAGDSEWVNTVAARFVDPGQRWNVRGAPVRRDTADVIADGGPREVQPQLDFVTNQPQAQRVAEIIRRLGRLWGRASVTLPPRFAFIEEGDWVAWQSDRRFGGATLTFRVDAWGSDKAWHHQLSLRQISASVYSDTAPLDDGVIASTQGAPPVVAAPAAGVWNAVAVLLGSGSVRVPNLRVAGTPDDPAADFVVFEYVPQVAAPDGATMWTFASSSRPDVRLLDIPVIEGGTYWVAVSYVVDGIQGARRVLGPISTSGLAFSDGTPVAPVAPANANRVPFARMEGDRGWAVLFNPVPLSVTPDYGQFNGLRFFRAQATATSAGQQISIGNGPYPNPAFKVTPGERLSVQARIELAGSGAVGGSWSLELWTFDPDEVTQSATIVATGSYPADISNSLVRAFVDVPSGRVFGRLEYRVFSGGAGLLQAVISEPMVTSAAAGQTAHPPFTRGPNASDGADPNNLITIDGAGNISGIGTANINVDNRKAVLTGPIAARPASGAFIGQCYAATDTGEVTQWDGFNWIPKADITFAVNGPAELTLNYASDLSLTSPLPVTAIYQLAAAGTGALTSGVSWSVSVVSGSFSGTAPSISGSGSGSLSINSSMTSAEALLRITATFGGRTYPSFTAKISRKIAAPTSSGGGSGSSAPATDSITTISSSSFTRFHASDLNVTLGSGVTSVALVASSSLYLPSALPLGPSVVEGKWQRETSPGSGTWVDVGAVATSSPSPVVYNDTETGTRLSDAGTISCNRTATGLTAGSAQRFRFVARVSGGNVRSVSGDGTVSATA